MLFMFEADWWHRPETLTKDLNINSACLVPGPNEEVHLQPGTSCTARGYAYVGEPMHYLQRFSVEQTIDFIGVYGQAAQVKLHLTSCRLVLTDVICCRVVVLFLNAH